MYRQRPVYPANYYPQYSRDPRFQGDPRYYSRNIPLQSPYGGSSEGAGAAPIIVCACVLVVLIVAAIIGVALGLAIGLSDKSSSTSSDATVSIPRAPITTLAPVVNPQTNVDPNNFVTVDSTIDTTVPYDADFVDSSSPASLGLSDLVLQSTDKSFQRSTVSHIYAGSELLSARNLNGNTRVIVRIFLRAAPPLDVTDTSSVSVSAEMSVQSILVTDSLNGDIGDLVRSVGVQPSAVQSSRSGLTSVPPSNSGTGTGTNTGKGTGSSLSAVCPGDIVQFANSGQNSASVTWSAPTVSGNTGTVSITYFPIGSTFQVGTTTVVATVTDSIASFQCDFDVTIIGNSENLNIICPPDIVQDTDVGQRYATVVFGQAQVSGQSGLIDISYNPSQGHRFELGTTAVNATAMDDFNTVSCTFQVSVRDNEKPALSCPSSRNVNTDQGMSVATISQELPTATDNVDAVLAVSTTNPGITVYSLGRHFIEASVEDSSGNTASCSWSYNVIDDEDPIVVCPNSFTVSLPSTLASIDVSFEGMVTVTDNVPTGLITSFQPNDFRPFGAGAHSVDVTATDGSGNTAKCTFTFTVSASCGIGSMTLQPRIIGGEDAPSGRYPWMASLTVGTHFCGSVIINKDWVLSAAHCPIAVNTDVIAGDVTLTSATVNRQTRQVSQIINHPSYVTFPNHDITLLRLNEELIFTDYVTPACLTEETEESDLYSTTSCYVAGWGVTVEGSENPSDILQHVRVDVYDTQTCIDSFFQTRTDITTNTICAGLSEGGADACNGDSGGALVCPDTTNQWHVVGVVSSGVRCAGEMSPGLYTRISQYIDFIYAYIGAELVIVELGTPRTLASPREGSNYPNDAVKGWRFRRFEGNSILLTFTQFDLAAGDSLTLGRGLDPSDNGSIIQVMDSDFSASTQQLSDRDLWFRFVSDSSNTATGFIIELRVVA